MSITLEADNRRLTLSSKYTYLVTNQVAGVTSFSVLNATDTDYAPNVYVLLGSFGAEDAEVVKISSVNNNTGLISLTSPTLFSHAESSKISVLPYDKVRFFHTTTSIFDIGTAIPLTSFVNLQPSDWFTSYSDDAFSNGFGWYCFYNSNTAVYSQNSNSIPYAGFESNTTEQILSDFFSMLSNKELKLVTREDALSWASEAYGRMRNKLNLTNVEYSASALSTLTLVAGQIEYDLPSDFDHLVAFVITDPTAPGSWGFNKQNIEFISLKDAYSYNGIGPRYYIRGFKLGIIPTPQSGGTYSYIYQKRVQRLSLNTDEVDLPNGGEYSIKSYMLYRAYLKFQNQSMAKQFLDEFTLGLNDLIISSIKRDANLDCFGISRQANV